jgi:hypothetical protein
VCSITDALSIVGTVMPCWWRELRHGRLLGDPMASTGKDHTLDAGRGNLLSRLS